MFSARVGRLIAGKVVYTVSCLLAAVLRDRGRLRPQDGRGL